jgi:hypothetical protein
LPPALKSTACLLHQQGTPATSQGSIPYCEASGVRRRPAVRCRAASLRMHDFGTWRAQRFHVLGLPRNHHTGSRWRAGCPAIGRVVKHGSAFPEARLPTRQAVNSSRVTRDHRQHFTCAPAPR